MYVYGDVVERNGVSYVCNVEKTSGYIPEDANSGFLALGDGVGLISPIDGGSYS